MLQATTRTVADHTWLEALGTVQGAYGLANVATALHVVLSVLEAHLTDLDEGWLGVDGVPKRKVYATVPWTVVFGSRTVAAPVAAQIRRATRAAGVLPADLITHLTNTNNTT